MDIVDKLILQSVALGEAQGVSAAAEHLGVSRQTVSARLKRMVEAGILKASGEGRGRRYALLPILSLTSSPP